MNSSLPRTKAGSLRIALLIALGVLMGLILLVLLSPSLLGWWPPAAIERRSQRRALMERVQAAGGWEAIRRDCLWLAERHDGGFFARGQDTNALPPAILALKPRWVDFRPKQGRVALRIFGVHSTGGHSTPYFGLEVVTSGNADGYTPGEGYGRGVIGNRHSTYRQVADGIYEIF